MKPIKIYAKRPGHFLRCSEVCKLVFVQSMHIVNNIALKTAGLEKTSGICLNPSRPDSGRRDKSNLNFYFYFFVIPQKVL